MYVRLTSALLPLFICKLSLPFARPPSLDSANTCTRVTMDTPHYRFILNSRSPRTDFEHKLEANKATGNFSGL